MSFLEFQAMVSRYLPIHSKALKPKMKEILDILQISFACIQYVGHLADFKVTLTPVYIF